jgi:Ca-activated chloride channel family protein
LLPLIALAFRRGWLLLLPLVLLPLWPRPAAATTWSDLWQRPDQQAAQALRQGQPKRAMELAKSPAWRGAAAYRAGDYAAAAQSLRDAHGADAQYNLGNALAKAGKYQEALAAYDRALKLDPAHADAKANRKAVEDWLRRQQKQKQSQQSKPGSSGQSSGQNKQGADNKTGQGKPGDQGKQDKQQGQGNQQGQPGNQPEQTPGSSSDKPAGSSSAANAPQPAPLTPQQQADQQARTEQARQALQKQMDQALQPGQGKPQQKREGKNQPHQLGALDADNGQARMPAELRQALQRVPDDPGALLRRKFELEYRQRHGAPMQEDEQP